VIVTEIVAVLALGLLAAGVVKVALTVWPPPGTKLPRPEEIGLPSGRLASPEDVHAALTRRR
jgi:hypothetical protein